jgi:hypothetical protein
VCTCDCRTFVALALTSKPLPCYLSQWIQNQSKSLDRFQVTIPCSHEFDFCFSKHLLRKRGNAACFEEISLDSGLSQLAWLGKQKYESLLHRFRESRGSQYLFPPARIPLQTRASTFSLEVIYPSSHPMSRKRTRQNSREVPVPKVFSFFGNISLRILAISLSGKRFTGEQSSPSGDINLAGIRKAS